MASQPAFKSSPLGLTEPLTVHSHCLRLFNFLHSHRSPPGESVESVFVFLFFLGGVGVVGI